MAAAVWGTGQCLKLWLADGMFSRVLLVGLPTLVGIAVYFLLALLLRLDELQSVLTRLKRSGSSTK